MSDLVNSVREKVPGKCCVTYCRKEGCRVSLSKELYPRVVVDLDLDRYEELISKNATRCDYIIVFKFNGSDWVVPLELTTGKKGARKIVEQLQAGASIAERIVCNGVSVKFRAVAALGRGIRKHDRKSFKTYKVKFRHKNRTIFWKKCGLKLVDVLGASP